MTSRVGVTATMNEHPDMTVTLNIRAALRPRLSAKRPKNQDPTGRMRKVTRLPADPLMVFRTVRRVLVGARVEPVGAGGVVDIGIPSLIQPTLAGPAR
jgi:hypothetical protein